MTVVEDERDAVAFLKQHARLTQWEIEFVKSVSQRLDEGTPLTSKQLHKLREVADRHAFYGEYHDWSEAKR